ncbi:MAG: hypothetical protein AAB553_00950 [Patescibacteria group bacterium]
MGRYKKRTLIKQLLKQGIHLWVILFLANIALVYSFTLYLRAAPPAEIPAGLEEPAPQSTSPTRAPTPEPKGPILDFNFSMPGIGSGGANFTPLHPKRNITVNLYPMERNVYDETVEPLYSINGQAVYNNNDKSPTFSAYQVTDFDLGDEVANGVYQITIETDQTVPLLLKEKIDAVGGMGIALEKREKLNDPLPQQVMIVGDIAPTGGNGIMDINDYNMFVNCFGGKETELCPQRLVADFDDNGAVEGTDYNLMVLSFKRLLDLGFPVPSIIISPTPKKVGSLSELTTTTPAPKKATPSAVTTKPASGGNPVGVILGVLFLIVVIGGGAFFLLRNKKLVQAFHDKLFPKPQPAEGEAAETNPETLPEPITATETPEGPEPASTEQEQTPTEPTEPAAETAPPAPEQPVPTPEPTQPQPEQVIQQTNGTISGDYFVKKQSTTDDNTGMWVTITNDNGPQLGLYKGSNMHEGFSHVTGTMQQENGKTYMLISQINPTD